MLNVTMAILTFTLMLVILKLFSRYKVDNLQAIVVNYITAAALGFSLSEVEFNVSGILKADWIAFAALIGAMFILTFNLIAIGAQKVGIAVITVANKMSVVIPVVAAIFLYNETPTVITVIGILLALLGIYLTSTNRGKLSFDTRYLPLVLVVFFGQGVADVLFNHARALHVSNAESKLFFMVIFISAAIGGTLVIIGKLAANRTKLGIKSLFWGIALGIPNYYTLDYFFKALKSSSLESSQVYPVVNMGVVVLTSFIGLIAFKENLSRMNWIGIMLSILAIAAISM